MLLFRLHADTLQSSIVVASFFKLTSILPKAAPKLRPPLIHSASNIAMNVKHRSNDNDKEN